MQPNANTSKKKANNNAAKNIRDDARSIKEDGAHIAETVIAQGKNKYGQIKSYAAHYIEMLEEKVAEKPVQSIALAVGAGMILSSLLKRR